MLVALRLSILDDVSDWGVSPGSRCGQNSNASVVEVYNGSGSHAWWFLVQVLKKCFEIVKLGRTIVEDSWWRGNPPNQKPKHTTCAFCFYCLILCVWWRKCKDSQPFISYMSKWLLGCMNMQGQCTTYVYYIHSIHIHIISSAWVRHLMQM